MPLSRRLFSVAHLISQLKISASLEAHLRGSRIEVSEVDPELAVDADRDLLLSAVGNLIQNALKFTKKHTQIALTAHSSGSRILIDVSDNCGGLPEGAVDKLFVPFAQIGTDRTGFGLGLAIVKRTVEANSGILRVRDIPGVGCVFTIDLPRYSIPVGEASKP